MHSKTGTVPHSYGPKICKHRMGALRAQEKKEGHAKRANPLSDDNSAYNHDLPRCQPICCLEYCCKTAEMAGKNCFRFCLYS